MKSNSIPVLAFLTCLICLISLNAVAQNGGEIIFSQNMIDPANPADLTDQFEAGNQIYAVAYFEKNLLGLVGKETATKVGVEIFLYELKAPLYDYQEPSEMQLESCSLSISGQALQNNFLPVDIIPGAGEMTAYGNPDLFYKKFGDQFDGPVKLAQRLGKLEPGEHTIIVKVRCNYNFVAEGRFTLSGDDFSAFKGMSKEINQAASGLKTKDTVMPKAKMSDKALEDQMTAAFVGSQTYQDRINGEVLRVVIIDPDWMIRRHEVSGIILHRYIRAAIAVKNDDGSCTLWQLVTFQQDYVSNEFQKTKFDGVGDPLKIPCENVHK
jgi:hypothetical protein